MTQKAAKIRHFAPFLRFHFVYAKYGYVYLELAVLLEPQFRRPSVGVAAAKGRILFLERKRGDRLVRTPLKKRA